MKDYSENKLHCYKRWIAYPCAAVIILGLLVSCLPTRYSLPHVPARIESIEGYGTLRLTGSEGTSKIKFSFLFLLPHKGRIESFDVLGRSLYYILIDSEKSFFVLPSKRVYWEGEVEEIIYRSLGFSLNQYEMVSILSGEWRSDQKSSEIERGFDSWNFKRDEKGRVIAGQREELSFEIEEFFEDSRIARFLLFHHPRSEGRLKILKINFNQPLKSHAFVRSFLAEYQSKSWDDIEKILEK
ncbi:MAG: hypothetical protein ACETWK_12390 [Candidatus Aminicenantaceae bacterium]